MNHLHTILATFCLALSALAIEPPPLTKPEAKHLLEVMEWRDPIVVTVREGVSSKGEIAPIYSTIVAFATRDGRAHTIQQTVHFDREFGWFLYEIGEKVARLWTKDGFREIKPFAPTLSNHHVPNP
jgi:hypothetical protein